MVDWSAAASPKTGKDSIWWALLHRKGGRFQMTRRENPGRRHGATEELAGHFATLDADGGLGALFEGDPALSATERTIVENEEAWILGA